jgi:hypothetical protein
MTSCEEIVATIVLDCGWTWSKKQYVLEWILIGILSDSELAAPGSLAF